MQYLRESEAVAEQVLEVLFNNSGEVIQRGYPVNFDARTFADTDGVKVSKPISGQENLFAGIAYETILVGQYGRFQVSGWCDYALVLPDAGLETEIGHALFPVGGQWYLKTAGTSDVGAMAVSMEFIDAGVTSPFARKVMLRCR